jgi:putative spermidine/putrescine transport system permease protein
MLMRSRLFRLSVYLIFGFLVAPILFVVVASFSGSGVLAFPPQDLSLRWYRELWGDRRWIDAAWTSLQLAWWSTLFSLVLGIMGAFAVAWRRPWKGRGVLSAVLLLPLAFPFTATGVALMLTLRQWGLLGTFTGFFIVHALVTLPYTFRAVLGSIRGLNPTYYEAALMHGANEWRAFWKVTVPLLRPGVMAGFIFAFLLSFDETTISMLLVGPFITTLPVEMFNQVVESVNPVVAAVSSIQIFVVAVLLLVVDRLFGLKVFTETH